MEQRARLIGGQLVVLSQPQTGVTVICLVPSPVPGATPG